jgi:anaerobic magnesium-protoporphyrin IX monomethyl ester cyclase
MRVLLINPPYSAEERYGKDLGKFGPLNEPLGLAYLAANLEKGGHDVSILDAPALEVTKEGICDHIKKNEYGLVGVTMLTPMFNRSMEIVKGVKSLFPDILIVVGGPHPTILPEETLNTNREIDFAVIGEGEIILLNLVNALENNKPIDGISGVAYRKGNKVIINPPPQLVADLDELPIPARHLLPMHAYHITRSRAKSEHAFTVSVARGCPFNCAFCCRIFGRKARHHSVERIIEEIRMLVETYDAKEINLEADTLTVNRKFIMALCDAIINSGLSKQVAWTCEARIDTVDEDVLKKLKEAGCWQTSYGVETGSQRLLDLVHKDITIEKIEKTFAITKKVGISIRAFYMLGIPTETREESLKTIAFAKKLDARWSQFTLFTPYPGTELYDIAVKEGGLKSRNWSDYKTHGGWTKGQLSYVPKGRSIDEMKALQKKAYRAVYIRPRVMMRFLRDIDSIAKLKGYVLGFWVLVKTAFPLREKSERVMRVDRNDLEKF